MYFLIFILALMVHLDHPVGWNELITLSALFVYIFTDQMSYS